MDLRMKALEFEERAKIAKNKGNYEEAAKFHRSAAEVYSQIGDEKNSKWNLANYHWGFAITKSCSQLIHLSL